MKTFDYLYGNMLGELILHHTDNLSYTLQHKSLSAAEGQEISQRAIQTIQSIHNDESFDLCWGRVSHKATALDINEPQLPRQKKQPRRYEVGLSTGDYHQEPKAYYRQPYFEAIGVIVNCIKG